MPRPHLNDPARCRLCGIHLNNGDPPHTREHQLCRDCAKRPEGQRILARLSRPLGPEHKHRARPGRRGGAIPRQGVDPRTYPDNNGSARIQAWSRGSATGGHSAARKE